MSYYYKYSFTSPESIYAVVREELKSYFDTGAVDDLLFPTYLNKCLDKLGKSSYVISQELLFLEDFETRLPDNFHAVREAWLCAEVPLTSYQMPNSFYSQTASTTVQIAPMTVGGNSCTNPSCVDSRCVCQPEIVQAVYKTNYEIDRSFRREYLLKPGNIATKSYCDVEYTTEWDATNNYRQPVNAGSSSFDSFDIRGNKFVTNFRNGTVHLVFYAYEYDEVGSQLVPDNYRIKEYVEAFIKYKVFETLTNQTSDETFNQLQQKMVYYKSLADEAFILADTEVKKQTVNQKFENIKRHKNRLNRYELPRTWRTWRNREWGRR